MTSDILNLLPSSVYWIQENTRTFLGCNRYFLAVHNNIEKNETIGKSIDKIFSDEYLKLINELLKKDTKHAKKSVIYFDNLDSSRGPLLIQYSRSLPKDIGVFSEVLIDTKILHKDLWNEKEKLLTYLNNIVEYVPASIYWKDKNSIILGGSQLHAELSGYFDRKEVIGKSDYEFVWKEDAEQVIKNDQFVMDNNKTLFFEETAKLRDGNIHTFLTRKSPLKGKLGEIIGVLGVSIDITELKETQSKLEISLKRAEVANQAKTEFLENMRHDIRTPLTGIVGCAHLMKSEENPEKVAEYIEDLVQSGDALLEFLNKILESITVASGEIPLLKKKFNLRETLEQIIHLNQAQAGVKKLPLKLDYDKKIPVYLIGDPIRVQRIVLELVTNALKFTKEGEVKVTARLMKNEARQVVIKFSVSDTGMGIPVNKQQDIYTRFKRLVPSYQGIYPGTGLGLSLVKQFLDDLGAEIELDSKPGQGSTFNCLIPFQEPLLIDDLDLEEVQSLLETRKISADRVPVNESSPDKLANPVGSCILLVEDEVIAARVAQSVLLGLDCQVDIASDGKIALEKIDKQHYDLVLMDVGLPDSDGCEVTRRIRLEQWQRNSPVPIIGLTAHIETEKKRSCLANGMNALYIKPLTLEKATEILNTFIPHQQPS